jgi:transposase
MHYELTDYEWTAIKPMLPNKPRPKRDGRSPQHATFLGRIARPA